ncbi:protein PHYTOCHROME KINASE SUBSTRATE 1-like [Durio zibethinus]|uniref:Protein PHYTOCHROME KINASE SUBSTRATE 1-like n=1 Tax=Durio zibethinus TaxID=66656 RepID=A0A6P5Y4V3_DURZI|nr:protein PHYTOCHROME KINASE SUBSTRATE 1-like [Durio zibethinus]
MAMVTLTSTYSTSLSQTLPFENNNSSPGDASFSNFPSGDGESHERKVSMPSRKISPKITNQDEHHYSGRKKEEDGEIGVFGAEKYFNGGTDHVDSPRITKMDAKMIEVAKHEGVSLDPIKPVIHQGTPSVRSESSWNSRNALLKSVMRVPRPKPSKVNGKSFLSGLAGCKCNCSDRNSVDIEEAQVGEISFNRPGNGEVVQGKQNKTAASSKAGLNVYKPSAEPWMKEDLFTFPTMKSTVGIQPVKVPLQGEVDEIERKSLEVFGSPVLGRSNKSLNLERRLKMPWDATPKVEETEYSNKGNYNDTESDASSDLFEIESLTGKANTFLARQASDAASGCVTPTTCYAPSEASIESSVVTGSAADFSVMSDYEELRSSITLPSPIKTSSATTNAKTKHNKEFQKAVKVAGDAYKTNEKAGFDPRMRLVSDSCMPATRFRTETKLAGFEPTQTPRILATRSLPHSH